MDFNHDLTNERFRPVFVSVAAHRGMEAYYIFKPFPNLSIYMSDQQCGQLMDALNSRDPLPKSDEQLDAEREDSPYAPGAGDVEELRG